MRACLAAARLTRGRGRPPGRASAVSTRWARGGAARRAASGVNVTLGLPIVRTSVDHGTAFDIVDRGIADGGSLVAALQLAAELSAAP